jgi:ABC-2 type transport system permease protein
MSVRSLLKKELLWSRHKALVLLFLLVVLPGVFAVSSVAFEHVIPRDAPVGVTAADDAVTDSELDIVEAGLTEFGQPIRYESTAAAREAMDREAIYAVVEVPSGITDDSRSVTVTLFVDGSMVPFKEPSKAIRTILAINLNGVLDSDVSVERVVVGGQGTLSEYLVPVFLMVTVFLYAFAYVPYVLAQDAAVLDRLRVETSLDAVIGTKLLFFTGLLLVPVLVFQVAATQFAYALSPLRLPAIATLLLTFLYLGAFSTAVMLVTRLSTLGRFVNVVFMLGLLTFSGILYPAGFFSPLRRAIVRLSPVHYSMIVFRSMTMRSTAITQYGDMIAGLLGTTLVSFVVLKLAIRQYERSV